LAMQVDYTTHIKSTKNKDDHSYCWIGHVISPSSIFQPLNQYINWQTSVIGLENIHIHIIPLGM
jgi:hypothetical protein